jgi:hypothetical protein
MGSVVNGQGASIHDTELPVASVAGAKWPTQ